ncbi:carboxymuconolactone decarboxylase family protein [Haliea sp. E17]|uniref:carboxymuconolactone decarboxylase family protein n=1 Tax=Haliea sp. E17 TaxID=3401576 RepID=UPI003AAD16EB
MPQADPPARLPQIQPDEFTDETRAFFGQWSNDFFRDVDKNPVLLTFAHHPALANAFSPLNVHVLTENTLPVRQRQIAIMRTAWICQCTYMWSSHLNTSQRCGLPTEIFDPIKRGADDPYFSEFERTVIRAAEELVQERNISEGNWELLASQWSKQQLLDFMFTVGCYAMVAGVMNSAGVERNPDLLALAEEFGQP